MTIPEITAALRELHEVTEQDVVNVITVASQAYKNKTALIKARYHMFAKALKGAYITLGTENRLILNRNHSVQINGRDRKVFECAVCDDCGRIAVAGRIIDGRLEFAKNSYDEELEFFMLQDSRDRDLGEEDDEIGDKGAIKKEDYLLCSKCGAIFYESLKDDPPCSCGARHYVRVRKARKTEERRNGKCPSCSFGNFKLFYLGYDAATAVLGTALFGELPESEKVIKSGGAAAPAKKGLFGASKSKPKTEIIRRKR